MTASKVQRCYEQRRQMTLATYVWVQRANGGNRPLEIDPLIRTSRFECMRILVRCEPAGQPGSGFVGSWHPEWCNNPPLQPGQLGAEDFSGRLPAGRHCVALDILVQVDHLPRRWAAASARRSGYSGRLSIPFRSIARRRSRSKSASTSSTKGNSDTTNSSVGAREFRHSRIRRSEQSTTGSDLGASRRVNRMIREGQ